MKNLAEVSTEKLETKLKTIKIINISLMIILGLLFLLCIYGLIWKEDNGTFSALIVVPIALSAILPLNFNNIKKIKEELKSRRLDKY